MHFAWFGLTEKKMLVECLFLPASGLMIYTISYKRCTCSHFVSIHSHLSTLI